MLTTIKDCWIYNKRELWRDLKWNFNQKISNKSTKGVIIAKIIAAMARIQKIAP